MLPSPHTPTPCPSFFPESLPRGTRGSSGKAELTTVVPRSTIECGQLAHGDCSIHSEARYSIEATGKRSSVTIYITHACVHL